MRKESGEQAAQKIVVVIWLLLVKLMIRDDKESRHCKSLRIEGSWGTFVNSQQPNGLWVNESSTKNRLWVKEIRSQDQIITCRTFLTGWKKKKKKRIAKN